MTVPGRILLLLTVLTMLVAADPTPPAVPEPAAVTVPAAVPGTYLLYPGDQIQVTVHDHLDLDMSLRVPSTGIVTYPLIGEVRGLVGRTIEDTAAEISRRLMDGYIRRAVVTITLREFGPRFAYILGSVNSPREILLNPLAPTSAMQAVGKAGGFADSADRSRMQLIRANPAAPGTSIALPLPAGDDAVEMAKDVTLLPGDIIVVPRLDKVYVLGQVNGPGGVNLPPAASGPLTVTKAITLAGGFAKYARQREVQVLRAGRHVATVDVRAVLTGESADDPRLEAGDTVYVPESRL